MTYESIRAMIQEGLEIRFEAGNVFLRNLSEHSFFVQAISLKFFEHHLSPVKVCPPSFDFCKKTVKIAPGEQVANR